MPDVELEHPLKEAVHIWEHAGLECVITDSGIGHLNGYVRIPEGHVAAGKHYDRIPVQVHGGLTYSNAAGWVGFDTAHGHDWWPEEHLIAAGAKVPDHEPLRFAPYIVWTFEKLRAEVNSLADQLAVLIDLGRPDTWNITEDELTELWEEREQLRVEVVRLQGERDRARDLAVQAGAFDEPWVIGAPFHSAYRVIDSTTGEVIAELSKEFQARWQAAHFAKLGRAVEFTACHTYAAHQGWKPWHPDGDS